MSFLPLLLAVVAVGPAVGTELQYAGKLTSVPRNGNPTVVKTFALNSVVIGGTTDRPVMTWIVDERGDGWPWPDRFGVIAEGEDRGRLPSILHQHQESKSPIALRQPVFEHRHQLAANAEWSEGKTEYRVVRQRPFGNRTCWEVEVEGTRGHSERLLIEASTGLVVSMEQRLFLGQGDEFELQFNLEQQKSLADETFAAISATSQELARLQTLLQRPAPREDALLTPDQIQATQTAIPTLRKTAVGTPFERLVEVISRDVQDQTRRVEGLEGLSKRFLGQKVTLPALKTTSGSTLSAESLKGQVVILHFWTYNGEQLKEPFGQVGYLDFLNGKRKRIGAKILGVATDSGFADPSQASAALRRVKKMQQFMNLSYEIATDPGDLLKTFGNPPSLGTPLPLWVVIGHDGQILHYHVGNYEIEPDRGLEELDAAVIEAVRRQKS